MAQTYTHFGAVHRVIFVTLALITGKEILSELFKIQMLSHHRCSKKIHYQMDKDNK